MKLDSDAIKTIVFIREAKLAKVTVNTLRYSLTLKQSLFKQVNACDAVTGWSSTTPSAAVAVASSQPTPLEGLGCIKVSHDAEANEESNVFYEPVDAFNLEDYDWISFAWLMDNVTLLSSAVVTVTQGTNNTTFNFTTLITEAAKWLMLRVHKTQFNNYGALD